MKTERRIVTQPIEVRKTGDQPSTLVGHAAVFNVEANIGGFFRERIAPGAFTTAIAEDDVRALFNHDPNYVLGRTTAGTLDLTEDKTGLRYEVAPPDTQWARDLMVTVGRGDVNQSSFGFTVVREEWSKPENRAELPLRTILEARLFDVSPVTYPAYEETTAEARSAAAAARGMAPDGTADPVADDGCECPCAPCQDGACAGCTNADCPDEECDCQMSRKAKSLTTLRQKRQAIIEAEL
jgi:HK97 family phage prohead protease